LVLNARGEVVWRRHPAPLQPVVKCQNPPGHACDAARGGDGGNRLAGEAARPLKRRQDRHHNRDASFIGFTDRLTTSVWFGNDDDSPMAGIGGANNIPAQAWRGFNEAMAARPFPEWRLASPRWR
jgi:hypothetical protein